MCGGNVLGFRVGVCESNIVACGRRVVRVVDTVDQLVVIDAVSFAPVVIYRLWLWLGQTVWDSDSGLVGGPGSASDGAFFLAALKKRDLG